MHSVHTVQRGTLEDMYTGYSLIQLIAPAKYTVNTQYTPSPLEDMYTGYSLIQLIASAKYTVNTQYTASPLEDMYTGIIISSPRSRYVQCTHCTPGGHLGICTLG